MKKSLIFAIVGFVVAVCLSASADVLVYEPFAYADGWLTGQGGALGTTGTWTANDTHNGDWRIHQEGDTAGIVVDPGPPVARNMFDGTVANLLTWGGYAGLPGPLDVGRGADEDFEIGRHQDASIALDPGVTATFQSGTTTWFSFVSVRGWDRNEQGAQLMIGTDTTPNESRAVTMSNAGSGIGGGNGPPRNNRTDIFPQYFSEGLLNNALGTGGTGFNDLPELPDATHTMPWDSTDADGFGAVNIVVGKIEWDADTGGEDIISVVRFLETDTLSEAAFDALIALKPDLSSASWASNKPDLDQSLFDTINLSGTKFFVDEIRLGTTFAEVAGGAGDPTLPDVDAGEDMITWSGEPVELDPNVVNNDPCGPQAPLTYLWSADDPSAVFDPSADVEDPNVTIIKPALTLTAVTIVNQGFEVPVLADGGGETDPPGWTDGYYDVTAPTVWVVGDSDAGVYNPTAADGYGGVAPEGDNVMYATSGAGYDRGMNQVLSANLQANTQYDLSALVGNPFLFNGSTTTADYRIELLAGGVVLESDTGPSPADDTTWTTASLTYNSGDSPAQLGEALEIRLLEVNFSDGKGVDFDDVKLSAEGPTPDPYTVKLTLAVNNEGKPPEKTVTDALTIYVYEDACEAARIGKGLAADNPGDFDGNCITDANDLAELATKWLTGDALTGPIPKP